MVRHMLAVLMAASALTAGAASAQPDKGKGDHGGDHGGGGGGPPAHGGGPPQGQPGGGGHGHGGGGGGPAPHAERGGPGPGAFHTQAPAPQVQAERHGGGGERGQVQGQARPQYQQRGQAQPQFQQRGQAQRGFQGQAPGRGGGGFTYRGREHARIQGPGFSYPRGYGYRRWGDGDILPFLFLTAPYIWGDYVDYGFGPPPYGYVWVRYGPDLLLVSRRSGRIRQVIYGVFY